MDHQLKEVHDLIVVLSDLVKFLVPEFKVSQQLLSTLVKLHCPCGELQVQYPHKEYNKTIEDIKTDTSILKE